MSTTPGRFCFGMTSSGERVDEKSALQISQIYACQASSGSGILDKRKKPDASGFSQVLSEDVHRNS